MLAEHETSVFRVLPLSRHSAAPVLQQQKIIELDADFERQGAWAGVRDLVRMAYKGLLQQQRHDVLDEHHYALHMVLSDERHNIPLKYACLTDTARGSEKTRNFPLDRAYRIVHSLVTLIGQWRTHCAHEEEWAILVHHFDRAQHLANRFFRELARRLTERSRLTVYVSLATQRASLLDGLDDVAFSAVQDDDAAVAAALRFPGDQTSAAQGEDEGVGAPLQPAAMHLEYDMSGWEQHHIPILRHYLCQKDGLSIAAASIRTLCMYDHYGYYHEANSFAKRIVPYLGELSQGNEEMLWQYAGNVVQSMITTGKEEQGFELLTQHIQPVLTKHVLIARMNYLLAMLHLRYLKQRDVALAEHHIDTALAQLALAKPELPAHDFVFLHVFLNNGLAFVRVRQGRSREAVELCKKGFDVLTDAVGDDKHRLHRSVLLYNSAQVYVALGQSEEALRHYREAIEMDPYYSEYYNEMGNLLQQRGEFAEALAAYDLAIRYSAPYPEVYFNRGICYSQLERWDEALASLAFSADLNPRQPDLHLLRAEILEQLGRDVEALHAYDALIDLADPPVVAHVNRAVLHYQAGNFQLALTDMAGAIAAEPTNADHYENRAEIHRAMSQAALMDADRLTAQHYREAA